MTRTSPVEMKLAGSRQEWDQWVWSKSWPLISTEASETPWLRELLAAGRGSAEGYFDPHAASLLLSFRGYLEVADEQQGIALPSEYKASFQESGSKIVLKLRETPNALAERLKRMGPRHFWNVGASQVWIGCPPKTSRH